MFKQAGPYTSEVPATTALARAIGQFAQTDGDHNAAIPALTLHRRKAPTEPLHCIYNLGGFKPTYHSPITIAFSFSGMPHDAPPEDAVPSVSRYVSRHCAPLHAPQLKGRA